MEEHRQPQRIWCNSCSCLEAFPISQKNSLALPSPLPLLTRLKVAAETLPLWFFFFFSSAKCLGGRAWTHCQALGFLVSLVSWWSWSSVTLHGPQILIPLRFSSLWYGSWNVHYSLEEGRFGSHTEKWLLRVRDGCFLRRYPKEEMQSHIPPGTVQPKTRWFVIRWSRTVLSTSASYREQPLLCGANNHHSRHPRFPWAHCAFIL